MHTFKKFIQYYKPYKGVFFLDMFCAMVVSIIDLAFPQILSWMTKDLFMRGAETILKFLPFIGIGLLVMRAGFISPIRGMLWAPGWKVICGRTCLTNISAFLFRITTETTPAK